MCTLRQCLNAKLTNEPLIYINLVWSVIHDVAVYFNQSFVLFYFSTSNCLSIAEWDRFDSFNN